MPEDAADDAAHARLPSLLTGAAPGEAVRELLVLGRMSEQPRHEWRWDGPWRIGTDAQPMLLYAPETRHHRDRPAGGPLLSVFINAAGRVSVRLSFWQCARRSFAGAVGISFAERLGGPDVLEVSLPYRTAEGCDIRHVSLGREVGRPYLFGSLIWCTPRLDGVLMARS